MRSCIGRRGRGGIGWRRKLLRRLLRLELVTFPPPPLPIFKCSQRPPGLPATPQKCGSDDECGNADDATDHIGTVVAGRMSAAIDRLRLLRTVLPAHMPSVGREASLHRVECLEINRLPVVHGPPLMANATARQLHG